MVLSCIASWKENPLIRKLFLISDSELHKVSLFFSITNKARHLKPRTCFPSQGCCFFCFLLRFTWIHPKIKQLVNSFLLFVFCFIIFLFQYSIPREKLPTKRYLSYVSSHTFCYGLSWIFGFHDRIATFSRLYTNTDGQNITYGDEIQFPSSRLKSFFLRAVIFSSQEFTRETRQRMCTT